MQKKRTGLIKKSYHHRKYATVLGAVSTEHIVARVGRAGIVGERSVGHPDAGAHALGVIFKEISQKMK